MVTTKERIENFTEIAAGDVVAYNRSGDVILGTILEVRPFQVFWYGMKSHIEISAKIESHLDKKISKVTNIKSLVKVHPSSLEM